MPQNTKGTVTQRNLLERDFSFLYDWLDRFLRRIGYILAI